MIVRWVTAPIGSGPPSGVRFCFPLRARHLIRERRFRICANFIGTRFMRLFAGEAATLRRISIVSDGEGFLLPSPSFSEEAIC